MTASTAAHLNAVPLVEMLGAEELSVDVTCGTTAAVKPRATVMQPTGAQVASVKRNTCAVHQRYTSLKHHADHQQDQVTFVICKSNTNIYDLT